MLSILIVLSLWLAFTTQSEIVPNETAQNTIRQRTGYAVLPGVGFSLGVNYGTSAIHFRNGSFVTLPKVEGSEGYKQFMRLNRRDFGNEQNHQRYRFLSNNTWFSRLTESFIPLIPTILYEPNCEDPVGVGIRDMLSTLKSNIDSQLGINLIYGTISIPYQFSRHQKDLLYSSLENLGFDRSLSLTTRNGVTVAYAYGLVEDDIVFDESDEEQDEVALIVDYTSQGLGLSVVRFAPELCMQGRLEFYEELGIEYCVEEPCESEEYWSAVQKAVMEIIMPESFAFPLPDSPTTIGRLLFSGDLVLNDHLLRILREVLGNSLIARAVQNFTDRQAVRSDSTYETAIGAAFHSSHLLVTWEYDLPRILREESASSYISTYVGNEAPDRWN